MEALRITDEGADESDGFDGSYRRIRGQLILLGLFRLSEALAWTTIFPYAFFMMRSFLPDGPTQDAQAAAYASLTVALFTLGEFLTAMVWAKVSDRLGRKPTLLLGAVGGIFSALIFGFSTNAWMALGARLLGGLVNPNVGVVSSGPVMLITSALGKSFSVVLFLRGLGSLLGPVIGGHLADPVKNMPSMFRKGTLWETFPYLLPNLVVVLFITTSGLLGWVFLEESHPILRHRRLSSSGLFGWLIRQYQWTFRGLKTGPYAKISTERDSIPLAIISQTPEDGILEKAFDPDGYPTPNSTGLPFLEEPELLNQATTPWTFKVILQIMVVSILAFHKVSSDVIMPSYLANPRATKPNGNPNRTFLKFVVGFEMASPDIANILLTQAVVAILSQLLVVPKVMDRYGPLKAIRWALFVFPWLYLFTPFTARFVYPFSLTGLLLDLWIKSVSVSVGYVASAILVTRVTPAVNGAAASIGTLARSIGAAVSGSMFHAGLASGYVGLPFWTLSIVATAGSLLALFIDDNP